MEPVLAVEGLTRRFGDRVVLSDVELSLAPGERLALLGANGVGKTTLLRCLGGALEVSDGTIRILGRPVGSSAARAHTGASLSQERSFYLRLSGFENLVLFARLRGLGRAAAGRRVRELADELQLASVLAERTDRCSSGQLQQLALARALLGEPALLLLDEPTRSLDTAARGRLWGALAARPAVAAVIATHLDEDVAQCTRELVLGDVA